jgi:hypothetical protein
MACEKEKKKDRGYQRVSRNNCEQSLMRNKLPAAEIK